MILHALTTRPLDATLTLAKNIASAALAKVLLNLGTVGRTGVVGG